MTNIGGLTKTIQGVYNTGMDKKKATHRLSGECRRLLPLMAMQKGVSQTAIIEMAVREMAKREGVS